MDLAQRVITYLETIAPQQNVSRSGDIVNHSPGWGVHCVPICPLVGQRLGSAQAGVVNEPWEMTRQP